MADLRDDLLRLAEEWVAGAIAVEGCAAGAVVSAQWHQNIARSRALRECAADLRSILARHPAPSPSVSRDALAAKVITEARRVDRALQGVRLPYENEGWRRLIDLRIALEALDAPAPSPRSEAEGVPLEHATVAQPRTRCEPDAGPGAPTAGSSAPGTNVRAACGHITADRGAHPLRCDVCAPTPTKSKEDHRG